MATLGERIKPSLKQSNPIAFDGYDYGDKYIDQNGQQQTEIINDQKKIDWVKLAISNQFFYSPFDRSTRFPYKVIYDDNIIENSYGYDPAQCINELETSNNAKEAWLQASYHHMEYCQVFPKGNMNEDINNYPYEEQWDQTEWLTFYRYFPIQDKYNLDQMKAILTEGQGKEYILPTMSDYMMNIKKFNHLNSNNIENLINTQLDYGLKKVMVMPSISKSQNYLLKNGEILKINPVIGDVNGDGKFDWKDYWLTLAYSLGLRNLNEIQKLLANVIEKNEPIEASYNYVEDAKAMREMLSGTRPNGWKDFTELNIIKSGDQSPIEALKAENATGFYTVTFDQFDNAENEIAIQAVNLNGKTNFTSSDLGKYYYEDKDGVRFYYQCVQLPYEYEATFKNSRDVLVTEVRGATQWNLQVYNQAYYLWIRKPSDISIDGFINYIQRINDALGLNIPTMQGIYRYDKRIGEWVDFNDPADKVVN